MSCCSSRRWLEGKPLLLLLAARANGCKVVRELQDRGGMRHGMVTLLDPTNGELILRAVHDDPEPDRKLEDIRYRNGEGIVGHILKTEATILVKRIADEPRFLGRLGLYD